MELHTFFPDYLRNSSPAITWARQSGEGREEDFSIDEAPVTKCEA
jgi:hypothetical protein